MIEEKPDSTFLLTDSGTPEVEEVPDAEEIREVARQVARIGEEGWLKGDGLDSLIALEIAAEQVGCEISALQEAIERDELLAVEDPDDGLQIPAFQLAVEPSVIGPVVSEVTKVLAPVCASTRTVWLWFLSPQTELEAKSPAQWLSDEEDTALLLRAAKRDSRRLGE